VRCAVKEKSLNVRRPVTSSSPSFKLPTMTCIKKTKKRGLTWTVIQVKRDAQPSATMPPPFPQDGRTYVVFSPHPLRSLAERQVLTEIVLLCLSTPPFATGMFMRKSGLVAGGIRYIGLVREWRWPPGLQRKQVHEHLNK